MIQTGALTVLVSSNMSSTAKSFFINPPPNVLYQLDRLVTYKVTNTCNLKRAPRWDPL